MVHDPMRGQLWACGTARLFVGKHQHGNRRQVLVLQQAAQLALRDCHAAPVCAVHHLPASMMYDMDPGVRLLLVKLLSDRLQIRSSTAAHPSLQMRYDRRQSM